MKDQYRAALDKARAEGKLVFVDFTGYSCANCHWMRANILARPEISALLGKFVLVELYTDGTDAASEANAKLEADKFKTVSQPYYVILQPDETVVATFDHLTHDPAEFRGFLEKGATPSPAGAGANGSITPLRLSPNLRGWKAARSIPRLSLAR